jgi:hypothetical protein
MPFVLRIGPNQNSQLASVGNLLPTPIVNVSATSAVAGQINLTWIGGVGNNVNYTYSVYNNTGSVIVSPTAYTVSGANPTAITFTDNTSRSYTITITATVLGGNVSGFSSAVTTLASTVAYRYYKFEVVNVVGDIYAGIQEIIIGYNSVKLDYTGATATDINQNGYLAEGPAGAIDGTASKWTVGFLSTNHPTLIIDFKSNKLVNSYTYITGYDTSGRDPKSFIFYGSTDNTTWVTLNTQTNFATSTTRSYQLPWITF